MDFYGGCVSSLRELLLLEKLVVVVAGGGLFRIKKRPSSPVEAHTQCSTRAGLKTQS